MKAGQVWKLALRGCRRTGVAGTRRSRAMHTLEISCRVSLKHVRPRTRLRDWRPRTPRHAAWSCCERCGRGAWTWRACGRAHRVCVRSRRPREALASFVHARAAARATPCCVGRAVNECCSSDILPVPCGPPRSRVAPCRRCRISRPPCSGCPLHRTTLRARAWPACGVQSRRSRRLSLLRAQRSPGAGPHPAREAGRANEAASASVEADQQSAPVRFSPAFAMCCGRCVPLCARAARRACSPSGQHVCAALKPCAAQIQGALPLGALWPPSD